MSEIKCSKCNRLLGEKIHKSVKLYGKSVSAMTICNHTQSIEFSCRSCSTDYNIEDGHIKRNDKSTNRKLLDNYSVGRMKKS